MKKLTSIAILILSFYTSAAKQLIDADTLATLEEQAQPFTGGFSGSTFSQVEYNETKLIIRRSASLGGDLRSELRATKLASERGFGPTAYHTNSAEGLSVIEFVPGQFDGDRTAPLFYEQLGATLRKVHQVKLPDTSNNYFFQFLQKLEGDLIQSNKSLPTDNQEHIHLYHALLEIAASLQNAFPETTLCHRELNPNNILYRGKRLLLIDWECCGNDVPGIDVADAINYYCQRDEDIDLMLKGYNATEQERHVANFCRPFAYWIHGLILAKIADRCDYKSLRQQHTDLCNLSFSAFEEHLKNKTITLQLSESKQAFTYVMFQEGIKQAQAQSFQEALRYLQQSAPKQSNAA